MPSSSLGRGDESGHKQMGAVLTGDTSEAVDISNEAVKINISSFVASVSRS